MADVGAIGERQFALWCEQANLTANPATQDRYGWDFLVQFPHLDSTAPLDTRPAQLKCMVQVKSTGVGSHRAPIKLDNWERMINDVLPWFVCAMVLDGPTVVEMYLVHIDQQHTGRVLERLRSLRAQNPTQPLHEITMDVVWADGDKVEPPNAINLRSALLRHMGNDGHEYGKLKREWYENAGYDGHPRTLTASILGQSKDEIWQMMADFSLGLRDKLPLYLQTVTDQRFGIPITEVDLTNEDRAKQLGYVAGPQPSTDEPVIITISNGQRLSLATFRCKVFSSRSFNPKIPRKYQKLRFTAPAFELVMDEPPRKKPKRWPVSMNNSIKFPPLNNIDQVVSLVDLSKISRVLRHLLDAPKSGLRIELRCGAVSWTLPKEIAAMTVPGETEILTQLLEKTLTIVADFGLDLDIATSMRSIMNQQEYVQFMWQALQLPRGLDVRIPFPSDRQDLTGIKGAIIVPTSIALGQDRLVAVFAIGGPVRRLTPMESDGTGIEIFDSEFRLLWKEVVSVASCTSEALAKRIGDVAADVKGDEFAFVLPPSAEALAQSLGGTGS